jgi:1-hydroxy-2-naphthoate dioxygenase
VVSALNQTFMEPYGEDRQPPGARLPSPETVLPPPGAGARMCFPWREAECALSEAAREKGSAYDGITLEYVDPETGAPVLPAHSCWLHLLRPGEATQAHRHTSSAVFHVVRGRGRTKVGDKVLEWGPRDCLAVPNWAWHEHANLSASEDAVLFSVNDTPLVKYLGLYREEPALTIAHGAPRMFGAFLRAAWA